MMENCATCGNPIRNTYVCVPKKVDGITKYSYYCNTNCLDKKDPTRHFERCVKCKKKDETVQKLEIWFPPINDYIRSRNFYCDECRSQLSNVTDSMSYGQKNDQ